MADESLSILGYGPAGSGKTTLSYTGPKPQLIMDSETASRFIPRNKKVIWDPMKDAPPTYDGSWDYCVVKLKDWATAKKTLEYLRTNRHPFKTVTLDSVSEVLVKAKEAITKDKFRIQHWGELGQNMGQFLRQLRDVTADADSPIQILYLIAAAKEYVEGTEDNPHHVWRPLLEGSTKDVITYLYDMVAFVTLEDVPVDSSNPGKGYRKSQKFFTGSDPNISAKSRPPGVPPLLEDITLEGLLYGVFPPDVPAEDTPAPAKAETPSEAPSGDNPGLPDIV